MKQFLDIIRLSSFMRGPLLKLIDGLFVFFFFTMNVSLRNFSISNDSCPEGSIALSPCDSCPHQSMLYDIVLVCLGNFVNSIGFFVDYLPTTNE